MGRPHVEQPCERCEKRWSAANLFAPVVGDATVAAGIARRPRSGGIEPTTRAEVARASGQVTHLATSRVVVIDTSTTADVVVVVDTGHHPSPVFTMNEVPLVPDENLI